MSNHVTSALTAITRFEDKDERVIDRTTTRDGNVRDSLGASGEILEDIITGLMCDTSKKARRWTYDPGNNRITMCRYYDKQDEAKNKNKIDKFICQWNTARDEYDTQRLNQCLRVK